MNVDAAGGGFMRATPGGFAGNESFERLAIRLATWIPPLMIFYVLLLWPLAFGSPPASLADEQLGWLAVVNDQDTSIWKQIAYPCLFVFSVLCVLATGAYRRLPLAHAGVVLLVAIMAIALVSMLWSAARHVTIMRAPLLSMIVLTIGLSVFTASSVRPIVARLFWVIFLVAVVNAGALGVRQPSSIGHTGIYDHKNVFGWAAAMVLYFGIYRLVTGNPIERIAGAFMVAVSPVFLIAAESKTSLGLAFICPLLATLLWVGARYLRLSPAVPVVVLAITAAFVFEIGRTAGAWDLLTINQAVFGNPTLTGRTEIWNFTLRLIAERPLLGYGYEAVFATGVDGIVQKNAIGFVRAMPTAHNGYLDIWVQIGLVGLVATVLFLVAAFDAVGRMVQVRPAVGWLGLTVVLFATLHNFLESDIMVSSNPLSMFVLMFFFIALRTLKEAGGERR